MAEMVSREVNKEKKVENTKATKVENLENSKNMEELSIKLNVIEAILFTTPEPISPSKIAKLSGIKTSEVKKLINELTQKYSERNTSIEIFEAGGKYSMRVKPEYHAYVEKLIFKDMEKSMLRTLAVIALKQPIKLSELSKIRGNRCYEHAKKLEEMGLIKSEKKGRTKVLTTTKKFAEYFGIKSSTPSGVKEFLKRAVKRGLKDSTLNEVLKKYINNHDIS